MFDIQTRKNQHRQLEEEIYTSLESMTQLDIEILDKKMEMYSKEDWDPDIEGPERSIVQNIVHAVDYSLQGAVKVAQLLGKASKVGYSLFKKGYEEARARLDKSGAKDLERTEKMLSAAKGDGSGTFVDKDLAVRLSIGGEKPEGIENAISEIVETTRHVRGKLIPNAADLSRDLEKVGAEINDKRSYGQWALKITDRLKKTPLWNNLMGSDGNRQWPGGYIVGKDKDPVKGHSEIAEYFGKCDKDIDLKASRKGYTAEGTLDVLSRDEILKIFKQVSNLINVTMDLGDGIKEGSDSRNMAIAIKAIDKGISEKGIEVDNEDRDRVKDSAEVLMHYDYLNYTVVVDRLMDANTAYIKAVLQYCRDSISKFEE